MPQGDNLTLTGSSGGVTGLSNRIFSWEGTFSRDALPTTPLGATDETNDYGVGKARGRAMAYMTTASGSGSDPTYFTQNSKKVSMTLTADSGKTFAFTALISEVQIVDEIDRVNVITFNWVKDGALTPTW